MAIKELQTRIALKYDSYENWQKSDLVLLPGELGICTIGNTDAAGKGEATTNPTVLFKVGDGETKAKDLKWASALAADVYTWAKAEDPSTITVKYGDKTSTLADILGDLNSTKAAVAAIKTSFTVEPATPAANGVVQGITYDDATGKFTVSYGTVATDDIAASAVTTTKIADDAVTTAKIADAAVTDDQVAVGISAAKISVETNKTLTDTLQDINSELAKKADGGHNHDGTYITPEDVDKKIAALGSVLVYQGTVEDTGKLPTATQEDEKTRPVKGDVWNITKACAASGTLPAVNAGDNVAWNGTTWDVLAGTVDLSGYYTKTEVNSELAKLAPLSHAHGNITNAGTIAGDALTGNETGNDAAAAVVVTDKDDKVTKMTPAAVRTLIGAGTSSLTLGTTAGTAAAGDHAHTAHEARTTAIEGDYVRLSDNRMYAGKDGTDYIVFNCGGATEPNESTGDQEPGTETTE